MAHEYRNEYASESAAIVSIAAKIGRAAETLRCLLRQPGGNGVRLTA
jgi:hypothetical protein